MNTIHESLNDVLEEVKGAKPVSTGTSASFSHLFPTQHMSRALITNVTVVLLDCLKEDYEVCVDDGKIVEVCPSREFSRDEFDETFDGEGGFLAPGFIDLHIHGTNKWLLDNGPDDLHELCRTLPRYGVTGFLPTVCPLPAGKDAQFVATLAQVKPEGAAILGFHLEGPFLAITGALPPEAIGKHDAARVSSLIEAARPYRAIFSVSPELDRIVDMLPLMTEDGTPAFITHTKASVSETEAAIAGGARHATHFYDVFYPPEEVEPGVRPCGAVEAILADPRATVDFILDGEHVDPVAVKMALQCKGPAGVCLITDANIGAGLPPARYQFGGEEVKSSYPGGPARFAEQARSPGALAGSGLTMNQAVRNATRWLDVDLPQAIRMASANPARVLGLEHVKGTIEAGFDADLTLLDQALTVQKTWISGNCMYQN